MRRQRGAAEWEYIVERDLVPALLRTSAPGNAHCPSDDAGLPAGAQASLAERIGQFALEDLLVIPPAAHPIGSRWRWLRRNLYSPRCVAAIGDRGFALWVQDLPIPGIRAQVPLSEIAAVDQHQDGPRGTLVVTSRAGRLPIRYDVSGQDAVSAWTRRLRSRTAAASDR